MTRRTFTVPADPKRVHRDGNRIWVVGKGYRPEITEYLNEPGRWGPDACLSFEDCDVDLTIGRCRYAGCNHRWDTPHMPADWVGLDRCETCGGDGSVVVGHSSRSGLTLPTDWEPCPDCVEVDGRRLPLVDIVQAAIDTDWPRPSGIGHLTARAVSLGVGTVTVLPVLHVDDERIDTDDRCICDKGDHLQLFGVNTTRMIPITAAPGDFTAEIQLQEAS